MHFPAFTTVLLALAHIVHSLPSAAQYSGNTLTAADIIKIAPDTASCPATTSSSDTDDECRDAAIAALNIVSSYTNFGIQSFGAQAALLALMLYESGDFRYNRNHFPAPGVPGQGTRNMQSPAYNLKYARFLATVCLNCGITNAQVDAAEAQGPAAVLALVNSDQWSFTSAAWFLVTQCDASVMAGLATGSMAGWEAYLGCIGTSVTEDRTAGWQKVMALGAW